MSLPARLTDFERDSLRERGRILDGLFAHYCNDWDGMTVDETCAEISSCNCDVCFVDHDESLIHLCTSAMPVPEEVKQNARDYYQSVEAWGMR